MKSIFCIALSILTSFPFTGYTQRYKNKDVALISFNVSIQSDIKAHLNQFEDQFPNTSNPKADKIIAKVMDQTWSALADSLQQSVGMSVLPIRSFGNRSNYNEYDYPNLSIRRAQQIGFSKIFIKIDIEISPDSPLNQTNLKLKSGTRSDKSTNSELMPYVTLTLTCYSVNGIIPIGKYVGTMQSSTIWETGNSSVVDGLVNNNFEPNNSTLLGLITHAISDVTKNMQNK